MTKEVRLSPTATASSHVRALAITTEMVQAKAADAAKNTRKREILVLHTGDEDAMQRMLNALQPGSYIRPHRHIAPPKPESLILLQGSIGFTPFLDDGTLDRANLIVMSAEDGVLAIDYRAGVWHTFFALEPDSVIFEVKPGPYDARTDKEFAPWSPEEGTPEGRLYIAELEDQLRKACRIGARGWSP